MPAHQILCQAFDTKYKAGLAYDTPYRFDYYNDYWSINETLADQLWDSIGTDELVVALDEFYQSAHGLPPSNPFPWDQSKGLYYIKSMHLLHCLVSGNLLLGDTGPFVSPSSVKNARACVCGGSSFRQGYHFSSLTGGVFS